MAAPQFCLCAQRGEADLRAICPPNKKHGFLPFAIPMPDTRALGAGAAVSVEACIRLQLVRG